MSAKTALPIRWSYPYLQTTRQIPLSSELQYGCVLSVNFYLSISLIQETQEESSMNHAIAKSGALSSMLSKQTLLATRYSSLFSQMNKHLMFHSSNMGLKPSFTSKLTTELSHSDQCFVGDFGVGKTFILEIYVLSASRFQKAYIFYIDLALKGLCLTT